MLRRVAGTTAALAIAALMMYAAGFEFVHMGDQWKGWVAADLSWAAIHVVWAWDFVKGRP
jgi:hypothetical protein